MKPKRFDRLWLYPEVLGQLSLAIRDERTLTRVRRLVEEGQPDPILAWLADANVPSVARRLTRLGLDRDGPCPLLFDEIVVATRSYDDGCGSVTYLLCRRVGRVFRHCVYHDGYGDTLDEFDADAPMSRREVRSGDWDEGAEEASAECELWTVWDREGGR